MRADEMVSNRSANVAFQEVLEARMPRRSVLAGGAVVAFASGTAS